MTLTLPGMILTFALLAFVILVIGPRPQLHFVPTEVRGAIVTCGGLCPGLNSVIHHLVNTLLRTYKAQKVGRSPWPLRWSLRWLGTAVVLRYE